ncbi:hypothetical protein CM19_12655 [Candidatus Acidianus copahuensis]|uniref:Major facilitator superfamily (MFS) profile domain-containing protein n=1 Tax=Candidatus Acidianus copahuensis TaxID=1160895 RepID=A0A031LHL5_9CREN|nr:MFS transporter [Candidatus Acidianus copahuensis]EZQ01652.1 hypothetical protein CM19_12655 [Candidatus Acidianus copahuensis]
MILYLLFYHAGVGGVGWVLQGETLPTEFRGRGMGILAAIDWFSNFFIIYIFPFWKASFGIFPFFIFELILSVLTTIYVITLVPETKGVPLDEIPRLFNKNLKRYWKIAKKEESK